MGPAQGGLGMIGLEPDGDALYGSPRGAGGRSPETHDEGVLVVALRHGPTPCEGSSMLRLGACHSAAWCAVLACAAPAPAVEPSADTVAHFTRRVQPLLLNACAAGACHGRPDAPVLQIERTAGRTGVNRQLTLANLHAFLDVVGARRDPSELVALLARRHPASAPAGAFAARPLSSEQRATLETWLDMVRAEEARPQPRGAVQLASGTEDAGQPSRPNRLRALLDAAAQPPTLPPPEQPRGLIFGPIDPPDESAEAP